MPSPAQKTITIVGSINADLVARTSRIPAPGETLTSEGFEIGYGGKGANQAVACARLSRRKPAEGSAPPPTDLTITMHAAIAADAFGPPALLALQRNGISTAAVHTLPSPPHTTGIALVLVDPASGENRILLHGGANSALTAAMAALPAALPRVVVLQLEVPVEVVRGVVAAVAEARRKGEDVEAVFNPAPVPRGGLERWQWEGVGHLIVNEGEAEALAGVERVEGEEMGWLKKVGEMFVGMGVGCAVVTLGERGVYYHRRSRRDGEDGANKQEAKEGDNAQGDNSGFIPAHKANVVDTTAAGDTFVGAYAIQVARSQEQDFDLRHACTVANWAAAKTVERKGAQDSIPWLDEIGEMPTGR